MCLSNGQRHTQKAAALHNLFTHGRLGYFGWIISIVLLNWVKSECRDAQAVKVQLVGQVSVHLGKKKQTVSRWRESCKRLGNHTVETIGLLPPLELLLGLGVVEYFGGYRINRRSSSFLIQRSSLVMALMAQVFVTRGLKHVYNSNLLVTWNEKN